MNSKDKKKLSKKQTLNRSNICKLKGSNQESNLKHLTLLSRRHYYPNLEWY